jgi:hypothetical protein
MKNILLVILATFILGGCNTIGNQNRHFSLRVLNHSGVNVGSVVLDPARLALPIGYMGHGKSGKTVSCSPVKYSHEFSIEWKEEGSTKSAVLDIAYLAPRRKSIQLLTFTYMGDGQWDVLAKDNFN